MGKSEKEHLSSALNNHLNTIHETLQILDRRPPSSLEKVSWDDVIKMGEHVSKEATVVGLLWTEETQEVKKLEENMSTYFNALQGFILLSHGSTIGAGPTLSRNIHTAVTQIVDCSFNLWKESVSSYGIRNNNNKKLSIPQLVGTVWNACSAIKKTPATNITAIGRAVTQVAVSIKDVLREMNELKPATNPTGEPSDGTHETDDDDMGTDLSPEEMKIAQSAITVVSNTLAVIKELIRSITGLTKTDNLDNNGTIVDSLERWLKLCQKISVQIDEIGACLYPPQDVCAMKVALGKILSNVDEMMVEMGNVKGSSEAFLQVCNGLKSSLKEMEFELGCSDSVDLVEKIQILEVGI